MELKKGIGKKTLFLLMVNGMIGTGIYFLPSIGASRAGPASLIAWAIMAVVAVLMAAYFAELVSMFPKSGGIYEYVKNAFGEFPSFIIGWISWIVANITMAMLVVGSLNFIFPSSGFLFNIAASSVMILVFNFVNYRGIGWSSKLLVFFGIVTLVSLLAIIIPGIGAVEMGNFDPFFVFPPPSVMIAVFFIAETFFGWEVASCLAEEVKDARKALPKMLIVSTTVVSVLAFVFVFVSLGVVNWSEHGAGDSLLVAARLFSGEAVAVFSVLVFITVAGTAASWMVSSPRLLYAMSRDKVMIKWFGSIHPRYRTPHHAIMFQTLVAIAITFIAIGDFVSMLSILLPLALVMYSAVALSVMKLRKLMPNERRGFMAPLGRAGPVIITVFNAMLVVLWLLEVENAVYSMTLGLLFIMFGIPLYILIKIQTDRKFTERFYDRISFMWDMMFYKWYSVEETDKVISKLTLRKDSFVLDFGCGSGFTTRSISRVIKNGSIVAVDISIGQLKKAAKKIMDQDLHNVVFINTHSLNFSENTFDAVTAVGVLEHMDHPSAPIHRLVRMLKRGGTFSFLCFGKSFIFPAPAFLKDEESIRKIFPWGTEVFIRKERKLFTDYWYVWGRKK